MLTLVDSREGEAQLAPRRRTFFEMAALRVRGNPGSGRMSAKQRLQHVEAGLAVGSIMRCVVAGICSREVDGYIVELPRTRRRIVTHGVCATNEPARAKPMRPASGAGFSLSSAASTAAAFGSPGARLLASACCDGWPRSHSSAAAPLSRRGICGQSDESQCD